jgi:hypothetical protein
MMLADAARWARTGQRILTRRQSERSSNAGVQKQDTGPSEGGASGGRRRSRRAGVLIRETPTQTRQSRLALNVPKLLMVTEGSHSAATCHCDRHTDQNEARTSQVRNRAKEANGANRGPSGTDTHCGWLTAQALKHRSQAEGANGD